MQEEERELTASRRAKRRRSEPGWNSKARSKIEIFFSAMPACTPRRPLPVLYITETAVVEEFHQPSRRTKSRLCFVHNDVVSFEAQ